MQTLSKCFTVTHTPWAWWTYYGAHRVGEGTCNNILTIEWHNPKHGGCLKPLLVCCLPLLKYYYHAVSMKFLDNTMHSCTHKHTFLNSTQCKDQLSRPLIKSRGQGYVSSLTIDKKNKAYCVSSLVRLEGKIFRLFTHFLHIMFLKCMFYARTVLSKDTQLQGTKAYWNQHIPS